MSEKKKYKVITMAQNGEEKEALVEADDATQAEIKAIKINKAVSAKSSVLLEDINS